MPRPGRALQPIVAFAAVIAALVPLSGASAADRARPVARASADASGWNTNAVAFRGRNGERFTYDCPDHGIGGGIYGTDIYTDDSSVCTAAVHVGLITLAGGGTVTIEIRPGEAAYTGTVRNRISSNGWGGYVGSFVVVGAAANSPPLVTVPVAPGTDAWAMNAQQFRRFAGAQYEFDCTPNGTARTVWGRDIYTDDSSVCTAAVHGGLITLKKGGKVKIEIRDGQAKYTASKRNGITTQGYPAYAGSFIVVDAPDGPDTPEGVATGDVRVNGKPFTSGPVRYGSTVDVTRGTLTLTAASVGSVLTFGDGADPAQYKLNKITETVRKKKRVSAELALAGGDFSGCVTTSRARSSAGGPPGKVVRSLWASGKGRFRTKGKYASATIRGTKWQTTDQCDGTLTTVTEGAVAVRDVPLKKTVVVRAGSSYLAKAP